MTKKDYELIATGLGFSLREAGSAEDAIYSVAVQLERDNPKFDRSKFLEACGVTNTCRHGLQSCRVCSPPVYADEVTQSQTIIAYTFDGKPIYS